MMITASTIAIGMGSPIPQSAIPIIAREHRHIALRKIHDAGHVIDAREAYSDQAIDGAHGDATEKILQHFDHRRHLERRVTRSKRSLDRAWIVATAMIRVSTALSLRS